jgi:hypothetical protein
MRNKNLISVNGKLEMQSTSNSSTTDTSGFGFKIEDIPNFD